MYDWSTVPQYQNLLIMLQKKNTDYNKCGKPSFTYYFSKVTYKKVHAFYRIVVITQNSILKYLEVNKTIH